MNPFATQRIGRTAVVVPRLGLGTAPLGGWPTEVTESEGRATVQRAWDCGIRYFDTAPFYGHGKSEGFLGAVLAGRDRSSYRLSTKVGRRLVPGAPATSLYEGARPFTPVFDFSAGAVADSLAGSTERTGSPRFDIALIHDPDDHHVEALTGTYPALDRLRLHGEVGAIGVAMNHVEPLIRFGNEADFDCFLLAGRYTLLEQTPLDELFPLALERGISIIAGGVLNSGLLADPRPGATYDYVEAPAHLVAAASRLAAICAEYDTPLRAAAVQFAAAHPAVATVILGARSPDQVDDCLAMAERPIPPDLWTALKEHELIRADAPVPGETGSG